MRGEHIRRRMAIHLRGGSSPHARGTLAAYPSRSRYSGIIPACAGNTDFVVGFGVACEDHPRMRGEHRFFSNQYAAAQGSSPHARGTPKCPNRHAGNRGIIPACAGNTSPWRCSNSSSCGSSPHARGTQEIIGHSSSLMGIIPACAGNTQLLAELGTIYGDHPRMRGEHCVPAAMLRCCWGSSPHARGTRIRKSITIRSDGIIPACAGNTCV